MTVMDILKHLENIKIHYISISEFVTGLPSLYYGTTKDVPQRLYDKIVVRQSSGMYLNHYTFFISINKE